MENKTWRIVVMTPYKFYKGDISANSQQDKRTVSILNNSYRHGLYDEDYIPEGYVRLENVNVLARKHQLLSGIDALNIRKTQIIFAYDEFEKMGSDVIRVRHSKHWNKKTEKIEFVTLTMGYSCFYITGKVQEYNQKMNREKQFIPIADAEIENIVTLPGETKRAKKKIPFLAMNRNYIESYRLG
jgi:hypothetical protein